MRSDRETASEYIDRVGLAHTYSAQGWVVAIAKLLAGFGVMWAGMGLFWLAHWLGH
jgi:hypothetical protein